MAELKTKSAHFLASFGAKPFIPGRPEAASPEEDAKEPADRSWREESLPLKLGPMGPLATGRIFDNKIAGQPEFQFNSHKGGDQWKGKTERYLISVVPAVHAIFQWPRGKLSPSPRKDTRRQLDSGLLPGIETA